MIWPRCINFVFDHKSVKVNANSLSANQNRAFGICVLFLFYFIFWVRHSNKLIVVMQRTVLRRAYVQCTEFHGCLRTSIRLPYAARTIASQTFTPSVVSSTPYDRSRVDRKASAHRTRQQHRSGVLQWGANRTMSSSVLKSVPHIYLF